MKINSIQPNIYANKSRPSFGVKFTQSTEEELYKTGEYYLFNYGEKSERFLQFKKCVKAFKELCPDLKMNLYRGWSNTKRPALKSILYDADGHICREFELFDDSPVADKRISTDNLFNLVNGLTLAETEYKEATNPGYGKNLLDKILK